MSYLFKLNFSNESIEGYTQLIKSLLLKKNNLVVSVPRLFFCYFDQRDPLYVLPVTQKAVYMFKNFL